MNDGGARMEGARMEGARMEGAGGGGRREAVGRRNLLTGKLVQMFSGA